MIVLYFSQYLISHTLTILIRIYIIIEIILLGLIIVSEWIPDLIPVTIGLNIILSNIMPYVIIEFIIIRLKGSDLLLM